MDDSDEEEETDDEDDDADDSNRLLGLPGVPGEAKLVMLNDDLLQGIERQRGAVKYDLATPEVRELGEEESEVDDDDTNDIVDSQISLPLPPLVYRQTLVYSATLTLPASANFSKRNMKKKRRVHADVDGAIAEILEKSRAKGKTKVVDLSNMNNKVSSKPLAEQKRKTETVKDSRKGIFRSRSHTPANQVYTTA
mmetsp:Transcript_16555/g.21663  ORF Transcript_16555/g.21663 Transcript_16555/m.21663 type:complete len:195 (+) Transcript_16555:273-857(+)